MQRSNLLFKQMDVSFYRCSFTKRAHKNTHLKATVMEELGLGVSGRTRI